MSSRSTTPLAGFAGFLSLFVLSACASSTAEADAGASPAPTPAEAPAGPAAADGMYAAAQAEEGQGLYRDSCGECHFTSEFRGNDFFFNWEGTSVGGFLDLIIETMPEDSPGSLAPEQYLAITAYILQLNDYPAGSAPLTRESAAGLTFERPSAPAPSPSAEGR